MPINFLPLSSPLLQPPPPTSTKPTRESRVTPSFGHYPAALCKLSASPLAHSIPTVCRCWPAGGAPITDSTTFTNSTGRIRPDSSRSGVGLALSFTENGADLTSAGPDGDHWEGQRRRGCLNLNSPRRSAVQPRWHSCRVPLRPVCALFGMCPALWGLSSPP